MKADAEADLEALVAQAVDEAKVALEQLTMERDESGRRVAVLSTQLDDARRGRDEEKVKYTESLATLESSVKALERVMDDPRLEATKAALVAVKALKRPDWEKELDDLDSVDLSPSAAGSGGTSVLQLLKDIHTKLSAEKNDVIDRESAEHESFTAMEPALLLELEDVQKGLEETRSELANLTKGLPALERRAESAASAAEAEKGAVTGQQGTCDTEAAVAADVEKARRDEIEAVTKATAAVLRALNDADLNNIKGLDSLSLLGRNSSDPTSFRNFTPDIEGKKAQFKGVQDVIQKTIQRLLEQQAKDTTRHFYCKQQIQLAAQALAAADVRLGELAAANQ